MSIEEGDRYFVVPVGDKYAAFIFKPYQQMEEILNELDIPYEMSEDKRILKSKKMLSSKVTKSYRYTVDSDIIKRKVFFFLSDVIDKVFNYYNVNYSKEVK